METNIIKSPSLPGRSSSLFKRQDDLSDIEDESGPSSSARKMSRRGSIFFGSQEDTRVTTHWPSVLTVQLAKNIPQSRWKRFKRFFDNVTCPCFDKKSTRSLFILSERNVIRMFTTYVIHHVYPCQFCNRFHGLLR